MYEVSFKGKFAYALFSKGRCVWDPLIEFNTKKYAMLKKQCAGLGSAQEDTLFFKTDKTLFTILTVFLVCCLNSVTDIKGR